MGFRLAWSKRSQYRIGRSQEKVPIVLGAYATRLIPRCYYFAPDLFDRFRRDRLMAYVQMSDLPLFPNRRVVGIAGDDAWKRIVSPLGEFFHHATESFGISRTNSVVFI